jgi:hypothetical protein
MINPWASSATYKQKQIALVRRKVPIKTLVSEKKEVYLFNNAIQKGFILVNENMKKIARYDK